MFMPGVWRDWRTSWYAISNWRRMWSGMESGSLCMTLTDQQSWKGIWWDWVWITTAISGFNTVVVIRCPFHTVWKRAASFSNIKSIAYITLELVDKVHRLAVGMSSYGVSEVGTTAGEQVDGRVNGAGLVPGYIARSEASGRGWGVCKKWQRAV